MTANNVRMLIVDDEPSIRLSLSAIFKQRGINVQVAEDGVSALAQIQHEIPHILVTDLNMPGMSGVELLIIVREKYPSIYVIAMSGAYAADSLPTGLLSAVFYHKGSNLPELLRLVDSAPPHPGQKRCTGKSDPTVSQQHSEQ